MDSNGRDRISECRDEIQRLLAEEELKSAIFLVMANKQDLPNAMSAEEVTEKLALNTIKDREWCKCSLKNVQGTCASSGDGLYEGLDWFQDN